MTYQQQLGALAASSAAATLGAWQLLPSPAFVGVAASLVARFNVRAVALADAALATLLDALPLGLARPDDDEERLVGSFTTLLERIDAAPLEHDTQARVERIARAEPLHAAQLAFSEAVELHASGATVTVERPEPARAPTEPVRIVGWRRKLNADACELCRWWSRGGQLFPPDRRMPTHVSCLCEQELVFD
jgi:hypothetical protein